MHMYLNVFVCLSFLYLYSNFKVSIYIWFNQCWCGGGYMCLFVCLALKVARACQACQRDSMNGSKRFIDPTHLPIDVAMENHHRLHLAKRYISCLPNTRFILSQAIKWNCSLCSLVSNVWAVLTVNEFMLIWFKLWSNYFPYQFQVVDQLSMISSRIVWFWSAASSFQ